MNVKVDVDVEGDKEVSLETEKDENRQIQVAKCTGPKYYVLCSDIC